MDIQSPSCGWSVEICNLALRYICFSFWMFLTPYLSSTQTTLWVLTLECYFRDVHLKKLQLCWCTSVWIYSSHHVKLKIERIGLLIKLCPTWFLQMVVETEKCGISMKMASPEDVSEVLAHIGTCLRRIFPGLSPVWVLLGKGEESRQPVLPQNGKWEHAFSLPLHVVPFSYLHLSSKYQTLCFMSVVFW